VDTQSKVRLVIAKNLKNERQIRVSVTAGTELSTQMVAELTVSVEGFLQRACAEGKVDSISYFPLSNRIWKLFVVLNVTGEKQDNLIQQLVGVIEKAIPVEEIQVDLPNY